MGLGGTQQATQTTSTQMSPQAQQTFALAFPKAQSFAAHTLERFPGQTTADFNPNQLAGQAAVGGAAESQQQNYNLGRAATEGLVGGLEADPDTMSFDPGRNTQLRGAIDAAQRPLYDNLLETVLPGIRDTSVMQGYGGSRQGIAEGLAVGKTQRAASDVGSKIVQDLYRTNVDATGQRYGQNINALLGTAGLTPMLQQAAVQPGLTLSNVGDVQQGQDQAFLNNQMANFNWDTNRVGDLAQAQELINLLQGFPGSSNITTANMPKGSPISTGIGGAATGASLGSLFGPIGSGLGALGGGLAGLLFG